MNEYVIVYPILAVMLISCLISSRRVTRRRDAQGRAAQARNHDTLDQLAQLYRDRREEPGQTHAWPPEAEQPISMVPTRKLPPRIWRDPCGCLHFRDGSMSCCFVHDTGVLRAHIEANADQWAADLWEEAQ